MNWIDQNQNRSELQAINKIIHAIAKNTDYDNMIQVFASSIAVRVMFSVREKLYREGLN